MKAAKGGKGDYFDTTAWGWGYRSYSSIRGGSMVTWTADEL